jgi:hypothetical protein
MNINWRKIWKVLLIVLGAWILVLALLFFLGEIGKTSEAKADDSVAAKLCKKYPETPACKPESKVASVVVHRIVSARASGGPGPCGYYGYYKEYKNVLHQVLIWMRLKQWVCFDGTRVDTVNPPEFTHGVTEAGTVLQWHDQNQESFSSGVRPWRGVRKGAYHTWASDRFEQHACVPVLGCVTINTATESIWVTALFDGEHHG